jgi:hypothetical protein
MQFTQPPQSTELVEPMLLDDLLYELQQIHDCLEDATPCDLFAARMSCQVLLARAERYNPIPKVRH